MENSLSFTMKRLLRTFLTLTVLAVVLLTAATPARAASLVVNSTGDGPDIRLGDGRCTSEDGKCTLRAAIQEANARPGEDTITFNFPGTNTQTITITSQLPDITDKVNIYGGEPLDQWGTPRVRVDGGNNPWNGLRFIGAGASNSWVRFLMLTRFDSTAIYVSNAPGIYIAHNFIGTDGTASRGNRWGIILDSGSHSAFIHDNLISGNTVSGMTLRANGEDIHVYRNRIGLDFKGSKVIPNQTGITVENGWNSTIEDNVISGNTVGVHIKGNSQFALTHNRIGADRSGKKLLANTQYGVLVEGAATVLLGSPDDLEGTGGGNLFGANNVRDMLFSGTSSTQGISGYNCFVGTTGIENNSSSAVRMENNWFGTASGPSGSGSGTGAPVVGTGVTDFTPWLNVPTAPCAMRYAVNLNGNMEIDADFNKRPDEWNFNNLNSTDGLDCNFVFQYEDPCSMMIAGTGANKRMEQTTAIPGNAGDWIGISFRLAALAVPADGASTVTIRLRNSANNIVHEQAINVPGPGCNTCRFAVQVGFASPVSYASAEIRLLYARSGGRIFIDNVHLVRYQP
jgi:CSLREA domain-containing protein